MRISVAALALLLATDALAGELAFDTAPLVLGRAEAVGVTLRMQEAPGEENVLPRLSASVGSFGKVSRTEPGVYRARYTLPKTRFPQVALVAVWRPTSPDAPVEFQSVPLSGATKLAVTVPPGAEVKVEVGDETFGPATADEKGNATLSIIVPPAATSATVVAKSKSGVISQKPVAVAVPPYNRLALALAPRAIPADGASSARLEVFYDTPAPVDPAKLVVKPVIGTAKFEKQEGRRYVFRYVAPANTPRELVPFTVTVEGDPVARAAIDLILGFQPPKKAELAEVRPALLPADGRTEGRVVLKVMDARGKPMRRESLALQPVEGKVVGDAKEVDEGRYEAAFVAPEDGQGAVQVKVFDMAGELDDTIEVPLRRRLGRLDLGARAGVGASSGANVQPRLALDALVPVLAFGRYFGAGLTAGYARQTQKTTDPTGTFENVATAQLVPLSLRASAELFAWPRAFVHAGLGGTATVGVFEASLEGQRATRVGFGGLAFVSGALQAGPGHAFAELSVGWAPVSSGAFAAQAGGVGVDVGYRLALF